MRQGVPLHGNDMRVIGNRFLKDLKIFRSCHFESANEELGTRLNDALNSNGYGFTEDMSSDDIISGNLTDNEKYALVNQINQKFVDIVRASGGNNANRFLLIAGYDTDISKPVTQDTRCRPIL